MICPAGTLPAAVLIRLARCLLPEHRRKAGSARNRDGGWCPAGGCRPLLSIDGTGEIMAMTGFVDRRAPATIFLTHFFRRRADRQGRVPCRGALPGHEQPKAALRYSPAISQPKANLHFLRLRCPVHVPFDRFRAAPFRRLPPSFPALLQHVRPPAPAPPAPPPVSPVAVSRCSPSAFLSSVTNSARCRAPADFPHRSSSACSGAGDWPPSPRWTLSTVRPWNACTVDAQARSRCRSWESP